MPDPLPQLEIAIRHAARAGRIAENTLCGLADDAGVDLLTAQQAACRAGIWPARYARNARQLSLRDQLALLQSRVLLVGLGGLGGWLLEQLVRMGVGAITGVDGDCFEESNLNRQSLGNTAQLGQSKAEAAAARVAGINPAVHFTPVPRFADKILLIRLLRGMDLALDALGGLACRLPLQEAAAAAGVPLVSAGIAGLTGWVAVVQPGQTGPIQWLSAGGTDGAGETCGTDETGASSEEELGNLAPTAATAASLQAVEALKLLTGRVAAPGMCVFDLADGTFQRVPL